MRRPLALVVLGLATSPAFCGEPLKEHFRVAGLSRPESFIADPVTDEFYISNVQGEPGEEDGKGFLARLASDGSIAELEWQGNGHGRLALNAPKGLAIHVISAKGASTRRLLIVSDITRIHVLDLLGEGEPETMDLKPKGARFLNDVAVSERGDVYVTDTAAGMVWAWTPSYGTEGAGSEPKRLFPTNEEPDFHPNGVATCPREGFLRVVTWGKGLMYLLPLDGEDASTLAQGLAGRGATLRSGGADLSNLDGIVLWDPPAGGRAAPVVLVSSYTGGTVHRLVGEDAEVLLSGLKTPADIGLDQKHNLLLVPLLEANEAVAYRLPMK